MIRQVTRLILATVLVLGCATRKLTPGYPGPVPLPQSISHSFSYEKDIGVVDSTLIRQTPDYALTRVRMERGEKASPIVMDYFKNLTPGKKAVILVLPILGGENVHANQFALFFAENGYSGIVLHRQKDFKSWFNFDTVDEMTRDVVVDIRKVLDWIDTRPELSAESIGILGISLGGMGALFSAAVDPRIKAAVIMLTGGDIPYILTHSDEKRIREKRIPYMKKEMLTPEMFHARMKETIGLDPLGVAPYMDAEKVLLMLALFDRVIPFETGQALQRAMGGPETVYLFSGHYTAGLFFSHAKRKSLTFFNKHLASETIVPGYR
jgi:hypothetical protein